VHRRPFNLSICDEVYFQNKKERQHQNTLTKNKNRISLHTKIVWGTKKEVFFPRCPSIDGMKLKILLV